MLNAERFKASICLIATYFLSNPFPVQAAVKDSAPKVTAAYVKNLVQQKSIGSVESLLAHLPEHFRSSFVLMHKSRSIQEATYLNPRVILMSSKGLKDFLSGNDQSDYKPEEVLMSFNGGGHHFGSESVEMIQWRQDTKSYELSEILFRDGKANFSGTNPSQCLTCHSRGGQSPTPIWDTYFTWPGAYGANDGIIKYGTEEDGGFRAF
ncbi:MAG: hypothetical protein GW917_01460, partial [Bdellovibrionales bacterium]|nr:hypothetical protein [Bdellovibrionales bacterium]